MIGYNFSKTYIQNTNPAYSGILVTYTEITWKSVKPQWHYSLRFVSRQNNTNCIMCSLKMDQLILHVTMFCGTNSERRHKMWKSLLDTVKNENFQLFIKLPPNLQLQQMIACLQSLTWKTTLGSMLLRRFWISLPPYAYKLKCMCLI